MALFNYYSRDYLYNPHNPCNPWGIPVILVILTKFSAILLWSKLLLSHVRIIL